MKDSQSYTFLIDQESKGTRLDLVLSLQLEEVSRSFVQKLLEQGQVKVNGQECTTKKYKVSEGDSIEILIPEPKELKIEPENLSLDIVYEDDDLLVINKQRGMVVHPAPGNEDGTLVNGIMYHCGDRLSSINGVIRPGIVHRIDKDTSGLLVVAKNDIAHESLSAQLAAHTIVRRYEALVFNNFVEDKGTVDLPIGRDSNNRLRQAVVLDGKQTSRNAVTHWSVIERFGSYTLIEAQLETGRTHQIRVHMAYIKHPLVGDFVYGPKKQPFKVEGQLLHAKILRFIHPKTGEYMEFETPRPEIFEETLQKLRG